MKKILMLLLVCTLVFSITFTMTSCDMLGNLFGDETPETPDDENPGEDNPGEDNPGEDNPGEDNPGEDNPGEDNPGEEKPGEDDKDENNGIFGGGTNGGDGIELPIVDVNSENMIVPPAEGEGETDGSENTDAE